MHKFSVVVCTHNPNPALFSRVLKAISAFTHRSFELIIVDNDSKTPVSEMGEVKTLLNSVPYKIISEKDPGLTNARIAGNTAASGDWLVWIDDDNEPASDYLDALQKLIEQYPQAGCWGPGHITVDYFEGVKNKWLNDQKKLFQERFDEGVLFDNKKE